MPDTVFRSGKNQKVHDSEELKFIQWIVTLWVDSFKLQDVARLYYKIYIPFWQLHFNKTCSTKYVFISP